MAQQQAYVNINQLPQVQQINNGDLLVVSTPTGTYTIDFANFIIPPDNTTFYSLVCANANTNYYVGKASFSITNGTSQSVVLTPALPTGINIDITDVTVSPTNSVGSSNNAYVSAVSIVNGSAVITLTSPVAYTTAGTFNVNVIKQY